MKKLLITFVSAFMCMASSFANNVQTANVFLNGQNTTSHFSLINYDISWENSWRTSTNESNYDGVWIFVKFRKVNSGNWQHATLNYVNPGTAAACGHTQATGSIIKTPSDGKGIFHYRSVNGSGNVNWTANKLRWNYGVDGVADNDSVELRLFAVEMVYCTQGAFNLGSGGTEFYHFRDGATDTYFPVTSENAITCGTAAGNLTTSSNGNYWFTGTLPAAFPKGFNAFWIMKYEFSQQQYVDFLNTIDYNKYITRIPYNASYLVGLHPNLTAVNPERAMTYISSLDVLAWLDWAAMRPFTELEFEKACRGSNQMPVANEYPWGNTTIQDLSTPTDQGMFNEVWALGNCNYGGGAGSLHRCGALATSSSNRTSSGASYYGAMEMGGNVWEWVVYGGDNFGQVFTGNHGDGYLTAIGDHNVLNWPNSSGQGLGIRGGATSVGFPTYCCISDRTFGVNANTTKSNPTYGGRGARTAE